MRIRSVWPTFWTSLTLARLTLEERLFFIALITYADDQGRERCDYRLFRGALFPLDDDVTAERIERWMDALVALGLVLRYESGGLFYAIRSWNEHQSPNKPKKSKFPAPPQGTYPERRTNVSVHPTPNGDGVREGKGREGNRKGMGRETSENGPTALGNLVDRFQAKVTRG